jgi:hypothetical protein
MLRYLTLAFKSLPRNQSYTIRIYLRTTSSFRLLSPDSGLLTPGFCHLLCAAHHALRQPAFRIPYPVFRVPLFAIRFACY